MIRGQHEHQAASRELVEHVQGHLRPLESSDDLTPLLERIGDARIVMLGEATHGTHEFYTWRTRISQRLVREAGFSFIAVEGDWPDCYRVNRYVKAYDDSGESASRVLSDFRRWPTWMWGNWEVVELTEWLRKHNEAQRGDGRVGFYGLDTYSLWESLDAIMQYLEEREPGALDAAHRALSCFAPYNRDPQEYAQATAFVPTSCEREVLELLRELRGRACAYDGDREARFNAEQNARAVLGAERYYRAMIHGSSESWNLRDTHMMDTLDRLLEHHGSDSKAIVWEHNTHIGDARATDMASAGMVNLGQLARERLGRDDVVLVGFGSHHGSVIAGRRWGAPMERMDVPAARADSWEDILYQTGARNALLLTNDLREIAREPRGHRAIGVVYDPRYEQFGNYVPTDLPFRYDAFLYFLESRALHPLHIQPDPRTPPDTYPWGE